MRGWNFEMLACLIQAFDFGDFLSSVCKNETRRWKELSQNNDRIQWAYAWVLKLADGILYPTDLSLPSSLLSSRPRPPNPPLKLSVNGKV